MHEAAVGEAMGFLEDHTAFTRRGHGGILQVDTDGLVAASFVHRTSRTSTPKVDAETPTEILKERWHEEAVGDLDAGRRCRGVRAARRRPRCRGVRRAMEALADEVLRDPEVVTLEAPLPVEAPEFLRREDGMT